MIPPGPSVFLRGIAKPHGGREPGMAKAKTVLVVGLMSLVAMLSVGLSGTPAVAGENLKLAHMFAPDSLPGRSAVKFVELVKEKPKGGITITVLPGGVLGDERANLHQLENNSLSSCPAPRERRGTHRGRVSADGPFSAAGEHRRPCA
jgi:hypothetical protein